MQKIIAQVTKRKNIFFYVAAVVIPVALLMAMLAPTAQAHTTYVITDGDTVKVYSTFSDDPAFVLDQAGISLASDDTYTTEAGDGISEITVQRNQTITIDYCGQTVVLNSYGETLQQLLNRNQLQSGNDYVISQSLSTQTYDGMEVKVDCIRQMEQTYTVDIPFETKYCEDPTLSKGQEVVLVEGSVGQERKTVNVVYTNSQITNQTVISEKVVQQPVTRIVAVGTGTKTDEASKAPAIGNGIIVTAEGEVLTYNKKAKFNATAYTKTDAGCDDYTATGTKVRIGTVAVDPRVIPYGTRMFIMSNDGKYIYGIATAEDCGGAIKENRIDLYFDTTAECFQFGRRSCTVYFLD